ncbi:hypothetical protein [Modestobacter sp. Leaf380]|uniref:hypothetical protein n=1 Tax=Modestobacter sp. Leaf380 TaxID=1736356 RepID=UPI002100A6F2|nr:hypothetical protein [Modestobacter sp. Leaf380]
MQQRVGFQSRDLEAAAVGCEDGAGDDVGDAPDGVEHGAHRVDLLGQQGEHLPEQLPPPRARWPSVPGPQQQVADLAAIAGHQRDPGRFVVPGGSVVGAAVARGDLGHPCGVGGQEVLQEREHRLQASRPRAWRVRGERVRGERVQVHDGLRRPRAAGRVGAATS